MHCIKILSVKYNGYSLILRRFNAFWLYKKNMPAYNLLYWWLKMKTEKNQSVKIMETVAGNTLSVI